MDTYSSKSFGLAKEEEEEGEVKNDAADFALKLVCCVTKTLGWVRQGNGDDDE